MQNRTRQDGKGKVERCFRTVKDEFFNTLDWSQIKSIEQVQEMYTEFLNSSYINTKHSSIEMSPRERFMKDFDGIKRKTNEQIEESFLHTIKRNVKSDSTISLNSVLYEVPQKYIKTTITVKYNPENMEELYIYGADGKKIETINKLDKQSNSKYKRQERVNLYQEKGENSDV